MGTTQTLKKYILKYKYEDKYGFGIYFVRAHDEEEAIRKFRFNMFEKRDTTWMEHTYRHSDFYLSSRSEITGWSVYLNQTCTTEIRVVELSALKDVTSLGENFEDGGV